MVGTIPPSIVQERAAIRLQRAYRLLNKPRAVAAARRLAVGNPLLQRLDAVVARTEWRLATLIQRRWRQARRRRGFPERLALKRIERAVVSHQARRVTRELKRKDQQEQAAIMAAVRLQAALRRCIARKYAARAARSRAVGLLRAQFSANRTERAVGRVQRAWVASVARRRELEARGKAENAELLALRLARARASELRSKHFARLIARHLRLFVQRRIRVADALRGWLSKRVQPGSLAPPTHRWRRRYFWVASGALLYDSVKWRTARSRGMSIRELSNATRTGACEFDLSFGRGKVSRTLSLRAAEDVEAEYWRRSLLWLAKLADAPPPREPLASIQSPTATAARDDQKPMPLPSALQSVEARSSQPHAIAAEAVRGAILGRAATRNAPDEPPAPRAGPLRESPAPRRGPYVPSAGAAESVAGSLPAVQYLGYDYEYETRGDDMVAYDDAPADVGVVDLSRADSGYGWIEQEGVI